MNDKNNFSKPSVKVQTKSGNTKFNNNNFNSSSSHNHSSKPTTVTQNPEIKDENEVVNTTENNLENNPNEAHILENNQPQSQIQSEEAISTYFNHELDKLKANYALLESQLSVSSQEIKDWQNKTLRISADLQNVQKQHELDLLQTKKSAKKGIALLVLELLNTFYLAFAYLPPTTNPAFKKFTDTLRFSFDKAISDFKNNNMEIILPTIGDNFNPETMAVITTTQDSEENTTVKQIVSLGLAIDNQVIKSAMVIV